jgi:hypothetical protein
LPEVVRTLSGEATFFGFDIETGRIAVFGLLLIVVMIYRPGGLLAAKRRRTELQEAGPDAAVLGVEITPEVTGLEEVSADTPDSTGKDG